MPWPGYHRGWRVVESRQPRLNTQGLFLFVPAFRCALLVIRFGLTVMRTTRHKRKPNLARVFVPLLPLQTVLGIVAVSCVKTFRDRLQGTTILPRSRFCPRLEIRVDLPYSLFRHITMSKGSPLRTYLVWNPKPKS